MTGAKPDQPTNGALGADGHCLTVVAASVRDCTTHNQTIPAAWDCCGRCPGRGHNAAKLNDGKEIQGAAMRQVSRLAEKLGVRFG